MSEDTSKDKVKKWKDKHRNSQNENRRLRRRVQELIVSRDGWRSKYKLSRLGSKSSRDYLSGTRARGHGYSLLIVELCIRISQYGGSSLRSCQHSLQCLLLVMGLGLNCPSHVSIRNWVLKHGYHRWWLMQDVEEVCGDWVLIMDESVTVGAERLLLVLGLDLSKWKFDRPPCVEDVEVLHMEIGVQWKGEQIGAVLEQAGKSRQVVQVLSDCGSNLLKASEISGFLHIPDCSHALARVLERHLARDDHFKTFCHLAGQLRQHWTTSEYAKWRPPKLRGKSRFMNVFPLVKWAEKVLSQELILPEQVLRKTEWLRHNNNFIGTMSTLRSTVNGILKLLKTQGASTQALERAKQMIKDGPCPILQSVNDDIKRYLEKLAGKLTVGNPRLLCCSDIIETVFGKFKCRINPQAQTKITDLALIIPHFCGKTSAQQVKAALENISNQQVKTWKKEQAKNNMQKVKNGTNNCPHF